MFFEEYERASSIVFSDGHQCWVLSYKYKLYNDGCQNVNGIRRDYSQKLSETPAHWFARAYFQLFLLRHTEYLQ
jgi:hypothetical protein